MARRKHAGIVLAAGLLIASTSMAVAHLSRTSSGACHFRLGGALPDLSCTPGALNHAVTQRTIHATICKSGWATSVRPPVTVTEPMKSKAMRAYGLGGVSLRGYEYDHYIPIELGGALDDPDNLWPEAHHVQVNGKEAGSYVKDGLENALKAAVCSGRMKLREARREIKSAWIPAPAATVSQPA